MLQRVYAASLVLQHFHCAHQAQTSGLVKHTYSIIKTQLAKFVAVLQICWAEALPLVLLNLRPTPFGTHELSPTGIVTGCPMQLASASFDPQQIKGKVVQYCKGLIASIKNNLVLVEQSFLSKPLGNKDLKHHILQPRDFIYWKGNLQKNFLQPHRTGL